MRDSNRPGLGFRSFLSQLISHTSQVNVGVYAANASFFIILSAFPLLVLVMGVLNLTSLTQSDLLDTLSALLPSALVPYATGVVDNIPGTGSVAIISITAVLAIWSASRGVYGVMVGINAIFGSSDRRSYLVRRAICVLYTLLLVLSLVITLALHVFGRALLTNLAKLLPALADTLQTVRLLRFLFTVAFLTLTFSAVYGAFPSRRVSLRACVAGAFPAALGWLGFSSIFSVIVTHSKNYTTFYGSLAMVAVFMLWLYTCMTILLMGGVIASILDPGRRDSGET